MTEAELRALLARLRRAAASWRARHGRVLELDEYLDEAMRALIGCLERYDPARGVTFATYAMHRCEGALRDCPQRYWNWHTGHHATARHGAKGRPVVQRLPRHVEPRAYDPWLRSRLAAVLAGALRHPYNGSALRSAYVSSLVAQVLEGSTTQELADAAGMTFLSMQTLLSCTRKALRPLCQNLWDEWRGTPCPRR